MNIIPHLIHARTTRQPFGVMVHTTGDGVWDDGTPTETALRYYGAQPEGPNYLITADAQVYLLVEPDQVAYHCGMRDWQRNAYLDGSWVQPHLSKSVAQRTVASYWPKRWPGVKSPCHLYPGRYPNEAYIGVEMIPCGTYDGGIWEFNWKLGVQELRLGPPVVTKSRFSIGQYDALAELLKELASRFNIDYTRNGRLVGHEDINPLTRPGWDPGAYPNWRTFSWEAVRARL